MTTLQPRLREEMVRRNYSPSTIRTYLHALRTCERYHRGRRLQQLGPEALRRYHAHLFEEKKLAVETVGLHVAALRFVFVRLLKRRELQEELPTPKRQRRLPTVLSPDEVRRLIAGAKNLYRRTMLMTLYGTGLRRSELLQLKVSRHRQPADGAPRRARQGLPRPRGPARCEPAGGTRRVLPLDASPDVSLSRHARRVAHGPTAHLRRFSGRRCASPPAPPGIDRRVSPHTLRHYLPFLTMSSYLPCHPCFLGTHARLSRHSVGSFVSPSGGKESTMVCVVNDQVVLSRAPEGPLAAHLGAFAESLHAQGYALAFDASAGAARSMLQSLAAATGSWPCGRFAPIIRRGICVFGIDECAPPEVMQPRSGTSSISCAVTG